MRKILFSVFLIFLVFSAYSQDKNGPKFSGLMFGDYFYNASTHDATKKDINGFQFRRIYITTDYTISNIFSTRFRFESTEGDLTSNGKITTIVKDAWLKWKDIFYGSDLILGISPTPAYDVSEGAWDHRYLEKTIMDLDGIVSSRDFGVDLKGKLSQSGTVKYWLKIGNNSGNSPEANKYKRFYGLLEFKPSPELLITIYGDYASLPKKADKNNSAFVGAGFINFKQKGKFSIGVESFLKSQQNNFISSNNTYKSQTGFGLSIWAYANVSDNIQLVGRFDTFDPNTNSNANMDTNDFILAGIQFSPHEHVNITPNVEIFTHHANSTNGGDKNDVTPRISFFWEF